MPRRHPRTGAQPHLDAVEGGIERRAPGDPHLLGAPAALELENQRPVGEPQARERRTGPARQRRKPFTVPPHRHHVEHRGHRPEWRGGSVDGQGVLPAVEPEVPEAALRRSLAAQREGRVLEHRRPVRARRVCRLEGEVALEELPGPRTAAACRSAAASLPKAVRGRQGLAPMRQAAPAIAHAKACGIPGRHPIAPCPSNTVRRALHASRPTTALRRASWAHVRARRRLRTRSGSSRPTDREARSADTHNPRSTCGPVWRPRSLPRANCRCAGVPLRSCRTSGFRGRFRTPCGSPNRPLRSLQTPAARTAHDRSAQQEGAGVGYHRTLPRSISPCSGASSFAASIRVPSTPRLTVGASCQRAPARQLRPSPEASPKPA